MNKNRMTKPIAVLSAAAVGLSLTGCTNYKDLLENDQAKYISLAAEDTVKAIVGKGKLGIAEHMASAFESGAAYITVDTEEMDYSAYFSGSDKSDHQLVGLSMSSDSGTLDLKLSADKNRLSASVTGPTANYAYGVDYADFAEKLESSIFAVNSGSKYALDEDTVNSIKEALNSVKDKINGTVNKSSDGGKYSDYANRISVSSSTSEMTVAEESVKADIITYSIDSTVFDDILVDFYKESYSDYYSEEEWAIFEQELRDSFDANMSMSFNINSKTHMLMSVTFDGSFISDDTSTSLDGGLIFGAKPDKSDKISFFLNFNDGDSPAVLTADLFMGVTDGDTTSWNANYSLTENGETATSSSVLSYNKADGSLIFTMTAPDGEAVTANAAIALTSDSAYITLNSIMADGENVMDGTVIGVKFTTKSIPAVSADKNFTDITEDEMTAMGEAIGNDFMTVFGLDY